MHTPQIAVLIANAISSALQPSFYDSIILLKQLQYLPDLKPNKLVLSVHLSILLDIPEYLSILLDICGHS